MIKNRINQRSGAAAGRLLRGLLCAFLMLSFFGGRCLFKSDPADAPVERDWDGLREKMVRQQIEARGVKDERVLDAMRKVERHLFVPEKRRDEAYADYPLPIGKGQTISQPYIVAVMSEAMQLKGKERCLEVGTGSGYQAAVLSLLCKELHTVEIVPELAKTAGALLGKLGYKNVTVHVGDGYDGIVEKAPFDAAMITAAPKTVPQPLKQQLKIGGRLVLPLGKRFQDLVRIVRTGKDEWKEEEVLPSVIFVPMTGKIQEKE